MNDTQVASDPATAPTRAEHAAGLDQVHVNGLGAVEPRSRTADWTDSDCAKVSCPLPTNQSLQIGLPPGGRPPRRHAVEAGATRH
jgi:hypothetical protein